jgi:hypothetical protein
MIPIMWPFEVWGLDLVGPLKRAPRGHTHLLVAIDKFSKWIEVRLITSIRSEEATKFFTNIIHHFGVLLGYRPVYPHGSTWAAPDKVDLYARKSRVDL